MTIKSKLYLSFLALTVLVLFTGLVAYVSLIKVSTVSDDITVNKMPQKDVSMETIIATKNTILSLRNHILDQEEYIQHKHQDIIKMDMADTNMYLSMLEYGTNTTKFKESTAGKMYSKMDLKKWF